MKSDRHVFIITYGRTGSTLLQRILNSISGYCIRGENADTLNGVFLASRCARFAKKQFSHIAEYDSQPWYGIAEVDAESFAKELVDGFIRHILRPSVTTRVSGFKEIRWTLGRRYELFEDYLDFIQRYFPNTKFIFNYRDLDQTANSGWWKKNPENRKTIERSINFMRRYEEMHQLSGSIYSMNYESWAFDSGHDELRGLFEFLKESYDEKSIDNILSQKLPH